MLIDPADLIGLTVLLTLLAVIVGASVAVMVRVGWRTLDDLLDQPEADEPAETERAYQGDEPDATWCGVTGCTAHRAPRTARPAPHRQVVIAVTAPTAPAAWCQATDCAWTHDQNDENTSFAAWLHNTLTGHPATMPAAPTPSGKPTRNGVGLRSHTAAWVEGAADQLGVAVTTIRASRFGREATRIDATARGASRAQAVDVLHAIGAGDRYMDGGAWLEATVRHPVLGMAVVRIWHGAQQ